MELPVLQPTGRPERADAARNRERILCAARRLFDAHGPEGVSMDEVAAEAGVGKGTLYRRFGDRSGLALALLESAEIPFQDAIIRGPAPMGPGAGAAERLHAFGDGMLDFLEQYAPLVLDAQMRVPGVRFKAGPYAFYRMHVTMLLREALGDQAGGRGDGGGTDRDQDVAYLADALLATLTPELFLHHRRAREIPLEDVRAGWHRLLGGILRCPGR